MSTTSSMPIDPPVAVASWKQEVNDRLAAHRTRRSSKTKQIVGLLPDVEENSSRSAQVRARVAARYAKAPSYSEVLAYSEVPAAADALAEPAAESTVLEVPVVQRKTPATVVTVAIAPDSGMASAHGTASGASVSQCASSQLSTRSATPVAANLAAARRGNAAVSARSENVARSIDLLAEATVEPVGTIAGNLIEFPREIVALRRARPRLAEGPLREEAPVDNPQLRIYEVDTKIIANTPDREQPTPDWTPIRLDSRFTERREAAPPRASLRDIPMKTAPMADRLVAAVVDLALAALALVVFVAVFLACTAHHPTGKPVLLAAGATLFFFFLLYQYLFFTYSECTPGMRYARISLCTFADENPTRRQLRQRVVALLLSACTLGMGFAWAWFDEDGLGWHDRLSRTYQRSYR